MKGLILGIWIGLGCFCEGQTVSYSGRVIYGAIPSGQNVSVSDCVIINYSGWCLYSDIPGATITLRNCYFIGQGVHVDKASSVTIQNCHLEAQGQVGIQVENSGATNETVWIANTDVVDAWTAIQLENIQQDPNVYLLSDRITQTTNYAHNDQISVYNCSGTAYHRIEINHCLVICNPDAPQVLFSAGIVAGDTGSSYVAVLDTIVLNGQVAGITSYPTDGTSIFAGNTVIGLGAATGWSVGLAIDTGAGPAYQNTAAWWDSYYHVLRNLKQPVNGSNYLLSASQITLSYEQQLIAQWEQDMSRQAIGYLYWPTIQLPPASEFPK